MIYFIMGQIKKYCPQLFNSNILSGYRTRYYIIDWQKFGKQYEEQED